ncbi:CDP-glycerol glycerophosphotransferase family protein [Scandinavium sp. NPDC088450]|uniref:CDP-glycerol glycerophosphotransferase family protein n=1 Tax=Scandinavium sp. NPDC088450 TaxID=3364514 RepID=UPI00384E1A99
MKYIKEAITLLITSIWAFLLGFRSLNSKRVIITSTNNVSYNFNSKYLFEYLSDCEEWKDHEIFFVINDKVKRTALNEYYKNNKFISSADAKGGCFCLRAKYWISSTFELPVNSLFRNPDRVVLHLGHGVPLKKIGLNEENISFIKKINRIIRTRQFTDIICYSEFLKPSMVKTFASKTANYLFMGQPRNDCFILEKEVARKELALIANASTNCTFILYAPTWRPYSTTKFFPFDCDAHVLNEFLKNNNIYIFTRSHPFYPSTIRNDISALENIISFNSDKAPEISDFLFAFDSLITDYSSIYIDYLIADKKVGFIPYDIDEYINNVGFCYDYNDFTPGHKILNYSDFVCFLKSPHCSYSEQRKKIRSITNTKSTGNNVEISEYLKTR